MKLKYLDREPRVGDIIEINPERGIDLSQYGWITKSLHLVGKLDGDDCIVAKQHPKGSTEGRLHYGYLKVVSTSPGSTAKKGCTVICLKDIDPTAFYCAVFENIPHERDDGPWLVFKKGHSWKHEDFLVLNSGNIINLQEVYDGKKT